MTAKPTSNWLVPVLLLTLGALNILFGALHLNTLQQGPPVVPDEFTPTHYFETPIPIVLHIVFGIIFNLLGPFQFAPVIRRRWPTWHRWSGRLLITSGFLVALTGLWMNQYYPLFGGALKYSGVATHSIGLMVSQGIALRAILARDIRGHRAWMMRAIAIGLGPATQRVIILPMFFILGNVTELMVGSVVWLGLLLNLMVVEWTLYRERTNRARRAIIRPPAAVRTK